MKIARASLLALLLLSCLLAAQPSAEQSAVEAKITATLRQMYEAEKRKDLDFVLSHLADDFAEVAGDGKVYHRSDIQAGWADVSLKNYELSDCLFKLMTPGAAYLSCATNVEATYKGQPLPQRFRVTTVWTRQNGNWLLRFEQGTILPTGAEPKVKSRNGSVDRD